MSEHQPSCVRSQFWDAGEYDAPCTCDTKEQEAGVTDGLIARLKAAHEAATPGPLRVKREIGGYEWVFDARDEVVMEGESGDLALYVLVRNALPEILNALEAAQRIVVERGHTDSSLDDADITQLRVALDALGKP